MTSKNVTVQVVIDRVNMLVKSSDVCTCEKCLSDIYAISLNNLQPRYVNTLKGEKFVMEIVCTPQEQEHMDSVIRDAVEIVKKNPRH